MAVSLQMGLGLAVDYALRLGMDAIWERVQFLAADLRQKLQKVPGVTVRDKGRLLCGIVSFTLVSVRPACLSVCLSWLSVCPSVCQVCLSVWLSLCLSRLSVIVYAIITG